MRWVSKCQCQQGYAIGNMVAMITIETMRFE